MRRLRYHRVDVFTDRPFGGNPLAVFPDGDGLDEGLMQAIAREMNLSETVFCLRPTAPGAATRLRIFTIDREVPLAGHPVVGTHHVLAATGALGLADGDHELRTELGAGVLPVRIEMRNGAPVRVWMTQRRPRFGPPFHDRALLAAALGLQEGQLALDRQPAQVVDTGLPWFLIPLRDLAALEGLRPDPAACNRLWERVGTDLVHAFTVATGDPECDVRTRHVWWGRVTPGEDPVTGSACGCLAAAVVEHGTVRPRGGRAVHLRQGLEVGRPGEVRAEIGSSGSSVTQVQVGGACIAMGDGAIFLDLDADIRN